MTLAIVGMGPRGLACLENLILELGREGGDEQHPVNILIFETAAYLGCGNAWTLEQPSTNYINISDHALQDLKGRETLYWNDLTIPGFPSYSQWCLDRGGKQNLTADQDCYPPRNQMGAYLNQRALSICSVLEKAKSLTIKEAEIHNLKLNEGQLQLATIDEMYKIDECLLTLGHLPTKDSEETQSFQAHDKAGCGVYIHEPYKRVLARADLSDKTVAIKGFGLTMIDIARQLTNLKYGKFISKGDKEHLQFEPSDGCVAKIVPFSIDGLPVVPKPWGRSIDALFEPSETQRNEFGRALRNALANAGELKDTQFLLDAVVEVVAPIFIKNQIEKIDHDKVKKVSLAWLQYPDFHHDFILDTRMDVLKYMKETVAMAWGMQQPSLDYTIGQVWRHLQPKMYRLFAFNDLPDTVIKQIVDLDEQSKRYSYGPPVKSILQLIALAEAEILDLKWVDDPTIELIDEGWRLVKGDASCAANMMVNSVMDAPVWEKIENPLIQSIRDQQFAEAVHKDLGVRTHPDGTLVNPRNTEMVLPIAILGRNAKGSILGADAILECFSPETQEWARGVVHRLRKNQ